MSLWQKQLINGFIVCGVSLSLWFFWGVVQSITWTIGWFDEGYFVLEVFFTLYAISICLLIFMEQKNPAKTMSWLLVFLAFPLVGFGFYMLLGRNFHKKYHAKRKRIKSMETQKRIASIQRTLLNQVENPWSVDLLEMRLGRLLLQNSDSPIYIHSKTESFVNGVTAFSSIISAIESAEDHVHLEYFIIRNDAIGNAIKDALIRCTARGVKVRLIYDSVGSWRLGADYVNALKQAGVETRAFFPVIFPYFRRELNYRNHRKILIVDGKIGFLGGLNIGDEYLGKSKIFGYWRDTHLKIEGEAVYGLQSVFLMDWEYVTSEMVVSPKLYPVYKGTGQEHIQIVASGPDAEWEALLQAYHTMVSSAQKKLYIATPYLVPEEGLILALKSAALSGVDVRILIPEKPDHFFVYWATQSNIEELLKAGVSIYRYQKGFMHSKLILADGCCATVGTANFDIRSLEINFEINAFLYDQAQIAVLEDQYILDLLDSKLIVYEQFVKRPFRRKFFEAVGRFASPLQ
jgi:cardiolipin synthase